MSAPTFETAILMALLLSACTPSGEWHERSERSAIGDRQFCSQQGGAYYAARGERPICIKSDALVKGIR